MESERIKALLLWPFLPDETKRRLRQQHRDEELGRHLQYMFAVEGVSVTLAASVAGQERGRPAETISGAKSAVASPSSQFLAEPAAFRSVVTWNGRQIGVAAPDGGLAEWEPEPGGLRPGFDPVSVAAAGMRPASSGDRLVRVAAIAIVGMPGFPMQDLHFLDAESRSLGTIPAWGFVEAEVSAVAAAAGIAYLRYVVTLAKFASLRVSADRLCEGIFPPSVEAVRL